MSHSISPGTICYPSFFFFQADDGIRDLVRSRGLVDEYKRRNQGERMEAINAILDMVWVCSSPFKESPYCFQMSNDMFVFYHIAHMAKHFIAGGCGIRSFIDLYLLKKKWLL